MYVAVCVRRVCVRDIFIFFIFGLISILVVAFFLLLSVSFSSHSPLSLLLLEGYLLSLTHLFMYYTVFLCASVSVCNIIVLNTNRNRKLTLAAGNYVHRIYKKKLQKRKSIEKEKQLLLFSEFMLVFLSYLT